MANSTAHESASLPAETGGEAADASAPARRLGPTLLKPVEAAAFWAGIGLPFLYLPLVVSGPGTDAGWGVALGLVALHAVTLYVGRSHNA